MAQSEVVKEFLVKLGVKVDEPSLKKFSDGIANVTKIVERLGLTMTGVAVGVAVAVEKFASNLEGLYFAANRVGTTVDKLKAFDLASENLGATASEATGALEALALAFRTNPTGTEGLLHSWGIATRDAKGNLRDMTVIAAALGKVFASLPIQFAEQRGGMLGISDHELLALRNPDFANQLAKAQAILAKMGFDKAAVDAHRFMVQLRQLDLQLQVFGAQILDALQNKLGISLKSISDWMAKNGKHFAGELVDGVNNLAKAVMTLVPPLEWLGKEFIYLDKLTDGWSSKLIALVALLRVVGGAGAIGLLAKVIGGVTGIGAAVAVGGAAAVAAPEVAAGGALVAVLSTLVTRFALIAAVLTGVKVVKEIGAHGAGNVSDWLLGGFRAQEPSALPEDHQTAAQHNWAALHGPNARRNVASIDAAARMGTNAHPESAATLADVISAFAAHADTQVNPAATTAITQNNTIYISGAQSPEATGRAVVTAQQRAQASVMRSAVAVVQ